MWVVLAVVLALLRRDAKIGIVTVAAVYVADGIASLLKYATAENRPSFPHALVAIPKSHSFPSGHTATAFAGATALSYFFPRATPLFVVLAAAIAYSRLYVGVHFPLDVLGGIVVGVATALLLLAATRRRSMRLPRRG